MAMYTDEELVEGCLKGKSSIQKLLYDKYAVKMLGVCMRYMKKRDEAEDILQEGFIKVFSKLRTYQKKGSLEGWIRRIMVNSALQQLRTKIKFEVSGDIDLADNISWEDHENNEMIWESITPEELYEMIQSLSDGYRTVFSLYAVDEFSHKEIAEILGITEGTSKSQLSRARVLLKSKIEQHLNRKIKLVNER